MRTLIRLLTHIRRPSSQTRTAIFVPGLLLLACFCAHAQTGASRPASPSPDPSPPQEKGEHPDFGDPATEIRTKLLIRADKKDYDENVARAKEAGDIATQVSESYEAKKVLTPEDEKKLERLEKLTKRIRNEAGGSDSEADDDSPPTVFEAAVKKVAELAVNLRDEVEKTPRHVISAAVIHQANKLISLIQYLRQQDRH